MTELRSSREVVLARRPRGAVRPSDLQVVERRVEAVRPGQILVRNRWFSVDPSTRIKMGDGGGRAMPPFTLGEPLTGFAVGEVLRSEADGFGPGDLVLHSLGWREFAVCTIGDDRWRDPRVVTPPEGFDGRVYLGALGPTGVTAWGGLRAIGQVTPGDTVYVSAAGGGVGSTAVQFARLLGHDVVGSAGSPEKVRYVREALQVPCFSHRDGDLERHLLDRAAEGIDVYFDNVGGAHLEAALMAMRPGGRVALCGAVAGYDGSENTVGSAALMQAVFKGVTLRGFLARSFADRLDAFEREVRPWVASGRFTTTETVYSGLESVPRGMADMLSGHTRGKVLVEVT